MNCTLRCGSHRSIWSSYGSLDGRTLAEACAAITVYPWETMGSCTAGMMTLNNDTYESRNNVVQYALGVDESIVTTAKSLGQFGLRDLYVAKFKSDILSRLSGRYLISVMANTESQSCAMGTGQKVDKFFAGIQSQFPAANFKIASICANENSSEGIAKVAADFNYIANTKYNLNLLENEYVVGAKLILNGTESIELVQNVDFRIDQGQFLIIKSGIGSFVRIDVQISTR